MRTGISQCLRCSQGNYGAGGLLGLSLRDISTMRRWRRGLIGSAAEEKSAMIESIEGKRGLPRSFVRPYVAQSGAFAVAPARHWVHKSNTALGGTYCREGPQVPEQHGKEWRARGCRSYSVSAAWQKPAYV